MKIVIWFTRILIFDSSSLIGKFKLEEEEFAGLFDPLLPYIGEFIGNENMINEGVSIECL